MRRPRALDRRARPTGHRNGPDVSVEGRPDGRFKGLPTGVYEHGELRYAGLLKNGFRTAM